MPKQFLSVKQVSKILGVTSLTIRNWDKRGKLQAYRNPINNYRVYKIEDVEKLLGEIDQSKDPEESRQGGTYGADPERSREGSQRASASYGAGEKKVEPAEPKIKKLVIEEL